MDPERRPSCADVLDALHGSFFPHAFDVMDDGTLAILTPETESYLVIDAVRQWQEKWRRSVNLQNADSGVQPSTW